MRKGYHFARIPFGRNVAVFNKAKAAWKRYRLAWRHLDDVSTAAWKGMLKKIQKF